MKKINIKTTVSAAFTAAEILLCLLIQLVGGTAHNLLCFAVVVLALLYVGFLYKHHPVWYISAIAMLFTVLADVCLVLIYPRLQLLGMCFFSVVQIAYFARILIDERRESVRRVHLAVRVALMLLATALVFIVLGDGADTLALISVLYYANLILNAVFSFISIRGGRGGLRFLLPIGLCLFIMCDLFIGMASIEAYIPLTEGTLWHFLAYPPINLAWLFYVPSQMLIALSLNN